MNMLKKSYIETKRKQVNFEGRRGGVRVDVGLFLGEGGGGGQSGQFSWWTG